MSSPNYEALKNVGSNYRAILEDFSSETNIGNLSIHLSAAQGAVKAFHAKFGCGIATVPRLSKLKLRLGLIAEECHELHDACEDGDIVEAADALCDIIYVVLGAALEWGIDLGPLFAEVHRTNMAKEGGIKTAAGKVLKPEGWKPPEIERLLSEQGYVK
jgi:predicted HAD superfamily Cof-like phosphohydrolase